MGVIVRLISDLKTGALITSGFPYNAYIPGWVCRVKAHRGHVNTTAEEQFNKAVINKQLKLHRSVVWLSKFNHSCTTEWCENGAIAEYGIAVDS